MRKRIAAYASTLQTSGECLAALVLVAIEWLLAILIWTTDVPWKTGGETAAAGVAGDIIIAADAETAGDG